jgi:uncharacterized RDD family membrane protein YckC
MAGAAQQLDTLIRVVTPESIAFQYRVAGPFQRLLAYFLDLLIRLVVAAAFTVVSILFASLALPTGFNLFGALGFTAMFVSWFLLTWFYGGFFETFWNGQTPGKRVMRLRVLSIDGQPINGMQAVLRNVLRAVDGLPYIVVTMPTYILGLGACMATSRFQRLGDLACGVMVIVEDRAPLTTVVRLDDPAVRSLAATLPADLTISRSLGKALAKFVSRRLTFSIARRAEIARHVGMIFAERFNLPPTTSHDLLLCAIYHRAFITDVAGLDHLGAGGPPVELPPPAVEPVDSPFTIGAHGQGVLS